jgi:2-polyprenyl-3-methyl-5-hydroxy-6-metoxy-1,4-benzoquinol methylase
VSTTGVVAEGSARFGFGENWLQFLELVDDQRVARAEASLRDMLQLGTGLPLEGRRFLDIGSGSGLFSLAARRLGATVISFDYDVQSVECTRALRERTHSDDANWYVVRGSILDQSFVESLGSFDVVYAWGVLHHTGDMKSAIANAAAAVCPGGMLFIALYNDQGPISHYWRVVKRTYNASPRAVRRGMAATYFAYFASLLFTADVVRGRDPSIRYSSATRRGMSAYRDVVDWVGGYPFEVASRASILDWSRSAGFEPVRVTSCGRRHGCNEFVLRRTV